LSEEQEEQLEEHEVEYQRPPLYAKQKEAMFDPRRISLIEASTKSGKTVSGILWLYEQAMGPLAAPGRHFWWVAPVSMQARIAFNRMRQHITDEHGHSLFTANLTDHTLTTLRDTVIAFRSGDHPDTLYGEDVYACVIDEASRFKEESWHAIRSTLTATRGPIRIIGNVKGRKNWFFQLARRAEQGDPQMGYHKLTAADAVQAGVLEKDEIEAARATLPEHVFRELYYAEPSDDEGNPFGAQHIRACHISELSPRPAVAWGWDLARKQDWTVGIGLDENGHVCEAFRFQKPWHEQVAIIKRYVKNTPALVDETGVGDPIVEALKLPVRHAGGNGADVIELSCPRLEGYKFTMASKQMLMEGLALAIHERKVRFPEGPISLELMSFEYEFTRLGIKYSAPPGMHDDCVCALALAWRCFDNKKLAYDTDLSWIGGDD
jgi:phage FluMu gp28-like protein